VRNHARHGMIAACLVAFLAVYLAPSTHAAATESVQLDINPRVCLLAKNDKQCETTVRAHWRSPQQESLCLIIVNRPEIKRCWEHYSQGQYEIELTFSEGLTFQLRDLALERVLASTALDVIREAVQYRRKRRQPWNVFD
jgi:Protein of unknown function (DUF3019)